MGLREPAINTALLWTKVTDGPAPLADTASAVICSERLSEPVLLHLSAIEATALHLYHQKVGNVPMPAISLSPPNPWALIHIEAKRNFLEFNYRSLNFGVGISLRPRSRKHNQA